MSRSEGKSLHAGRTYSRYVALATSEKEMLMLVVEVKQKVSCRAWETKRHSISVLGSQLFIR